MCYKVRYCVLIGSIPSHSPESSHHPLLHHTPIYAYTSSPLTSLLSHIAIYTYMFLESKIFQNCTLNFYYSRMRHLEITLSLYFVPELYCLTFRHVRIDSVGTPGKYRKEHNLSGVCYLSQLLRLFPFFKINRTVSGICEYSSDKQEDLTKRSWHVGRIRTSSGVTLFHFDGRTPLPA